METPRQITASEVMEAFRRGRVFGFYPRKRKIALDGFPARPATPDAIRTAIQLLNERRGK